MRLPIHHGCAAKYTIRAAIGVSVNRPIKKSKMNKCSRIEQIIEYGWYLCQGEYKKENPMAGE
jgi:hypothetical protein